MKCLAVLFFVLFADVILASPITSRGEPRWHMVPDGKGKMHMVDLDPMDMPVEPHWDDPRAEIIFLLFTRRNPLVGQVITFDTASILNSNFDASHPTRFTIHGWNGDPSNPVNVDSAAAYFIHGEYNMITVDWTAGAGTPNYITGRNRVPVGATVVAEFIDFLHLHNFVRFEDLHVIGHSLGGQMAGITGKRVTRGRIQVIYGLDPAGPLFFLGLPDGRIAPTDGVYVEVMHTNGGGLGFLEPIGQANFFPNGGRLQPGCGTDIGGVCSHLLTADFYAESINSIFTSIGCSSWEEIDNGECTPTGVTARMGGPFGNIGLTGNFTLTTNEQSPFSQG